MMDSIISDPRKDPLGAMMLDYLKGNQQAFVEVESSTLEMWEMPGKTMFRSYAEMDELERQALALCRGRILDVGAGSGCHSLYLQQQGLDVDALDISPGCIRVMELQQVKNIVHQNLFSLSEKKYDTILMLMNGLGICGSLDGCNLFLQFVKIILEDGGQVIAESTVLEVPDEEALDFEEEEDEYQGQTEFVMRYGDIVSDSFDWIYLDFATLETLVTFNGLECELLATDTAGKYLVQIF
ncbi:bifunctional 2-polyprenyl-6-hydroxyphenol methylase/3-demethylubiquinol 3-O-methyltransferase UbiG [Desulfopila sp. IMCC35008]|uniref:class I SAM-dependent methyltransferase n=1 Tax=Desulfopila sp. IMCC35008 TaxID=2653858 RepID=UPI0013D57BBE|nr:methyltransferase domain-containing protein [Desulfopila sp. IMCC35008]